MINFPTWFPNINPHFICIIITRKLANFNIHFLNKYFNQFNLYIFVSEVHNTDLVKRSLSVYKPKWSVFSISKAIVICIIIYQM